MISLPEGATPADIVGEIDILAGQDWLNSRLVEEYARLMTDETFPWEAFNHSEPIAFQHGANGIVISQGHHRWVAARLAGVEIPVKIRVLKDFRPGAVPYAVPWSRVAWRNE